MSTGTLYFGAIVKPGHHLWCSESLQVYRTTGVLFPQMAIDGVYVPKTRTDQGAACLVQVANWTILAWHDYTCDQRPGSNSALLVEGAWELPEVLRRGRAVFPSVEHERDHRRTRRQHRLQALLSAWCGCAAAVPMLLVGGAEGPW